MPDERPGADQHEHEVDELAKGLPGLPVEIGRVRVDEKGFHRKAGWFRRELYVAWMNVTAVRHRDSCYVAVEACRDKGRSAEVLRIPAERSNERVVEQAWNEYVLRKIERDGTLSGTVSPTFYRTPWYAVGYGLLHILTILCYYGVLDETRRAVDDNLMTSTFGGCLSGLMFVFVWFVGIRGLWMELRLRRGRTHWEVSPDGLTVGIGDGRRTVSASAAGVLELMSARIGGERLSPFRLPGFPVSAGIVLARAERSGARLRPLLPFSRVLLLGMLVFWPLNGLARMVTSPKPILATSNIFGVVLTAIMMALVVRLMVAYRQDFDRIVSDGRAMLEHLGW